MPVLPESMPLGPQQIVAIIEHSGLNQTEIAKQVGVERTAVSKWKKGKTAPDPVKAVRLRNLTPAPTHRAKWADFCAREQAKAGGPPGPEPSPLDPKALAETIAGILAPVLKVDVGVLAKLLAEKFDAKGIALDMTGQLLPDLRKLVEELAQKFAATSDGQENAVEEALAACAERLAPLLTQNTSDVADAVAVKTGGLVATLKSGLDALALSVKDGLDTAIGVLQGLVSKVDSQTAQNAQERAEDRAKRDELGNGVQQLQATANKVEGAAKRIEAKADKLQAKADELGNKADAHDGQSARRHHVMLGTMMVGFAGLAALIVACTSYLAGRPVPGDGHTRGGGVAEEAVRGGQQGSWKTWGSPLDEGNPGVEAGTGERKRGDPMPHHPLPGQAVAPCRGSADTLYGACWFRGDFKPPCPPDTFQEGTNCYVPIPAKPNAPRSTEPKRSGQEAPSREQDDAGMPAKNEEAKGQGI